LLDRIELAVLLEALDRQDVAPVGLDRQDRAGLDRHAVELDRAGAAVRRVAADVRARQAQVLAKKVDEEQARLDLGLLRRAVDRDRDAVPRQGSAPCARAIAIASALAVRTLAISFL